MKKRVIRDTIVTILILLLSFGTGLAIHNFFIHNSLIPSVFVLAIFLIAFTTNGYWYGLISAPICVLAVNFAFTFPYLAFDFTIPENIVSAVIMIFVTLCTSTLTTKIKKHEEARLAAEKEKMRANLLRAISHDIRTPLTSVYGSASTLIESYNTLSDETKIDILGGIKEDSQWLIRMVENLLSITKVDTGSINLIMSEVVLEELVDAVLTKLKKSYPAQNVELSMPDEIIIIAADGILIEQVILNLLENAIEHAEGMTELKLNITYSDGKVLFEVIDNGCGISKDKLKNIFGGYYMDESTPKDSQKRYMGIGLSVCSTIIKAHGGEIGAENVGGGGMKFHFSLDGAEADDE